MIYHLHSAKKGFVFPYTFEMKILFSRGLVNFHPWYFLDGAESEERESYVIHKNYMETNILFCQRFDGDDSVATFDVVNNRINCLDLESGEITKNYESFWAFFRYVVDEMILFDDEI